MEGYIKLCGSVVLLLLLLSSYTESFNFCLMRGGCYKTHENVNRPIDFHVCGNDIYTIYYDVCRQRRKRGRRTIANIFIQILGYQLRQFTVVPRAAFGLMVQEFDACGFPSPRLIPLKQLLFIRLNSA